MPLQNNPFVIQEQPSTMADFFRKLIGSQMLGQMQPSQMPVAPSWQSSSGEPTFGASAEATPPETQSAFSQLQRLLEPTRASITSSPTPPDVEGNMSWINRLGRAMTPAPVDQVFYGPDTAFGQAHPQMGAFADMLRRQSAFLDPTGLPAQEYNYQRGLEEQRRAMSLQQFLTGAKVAEPLDAMAAAQTKGEQDMMTAETVRAQNMAQANAANVLTRQRSLMEVSPGATAIDTENTNYPYTAPGTATTSANPYGTSPTGLLVNAFVAENGRPPNVAELQALQKSTRSDTIYSAYQYIDGYNADGSPIIKYGSPTGVIGKEVPKTTYDSAGRPTTGTAVGFSTSPPPTIPAATQDTLAGWSNSIKLIDDLLPQIKGTATSFGPALGRIKSVQMGKLGGAGLSTDEVKLATSLRRLLTSEAFANGGKQLTITELSQYQQLLPAMTDTFETALMKASQAREFLSGKMTERIRFLAPRQQDQLPSQAIPSTPGATTASPSFTTPTSGTIRVISPDGQTGTIPAEDWPDAQSEGYQRAP